MATSVFSQIAFPSFNILDSLVNLARERSWDLSSINGITLNTLHASRIPSKPFIIGFIPPDFVVNYVPTQATQTASNSVTAVTIPSSPAPIPGPVPASNIRATNNPPSMYQAIQSGSAANKYNPADMLAIQLQESGINATRLSNYKDPASGVPVAFGVIQFTDATAVSLGTTREALLQMDTTQQQAYVQKFYAGAAGAPTAGALYVYGISPSAYRASGGGKNTDYAIYNKPSANYAANAGLDVGNKGYISVGDMNTAMDAIKATPAYAQVVSAYNYSTNTTLTTTNASIPAVSNAAPVATTRIMTNGNITDAVIANLNSGLGQNITISDTRVKTIQAQTNYLNQQIQLIQQTPALMMLVNPEEFNRNYEAQVDPVKTRSGYVVNMWLEKPVQISAKGVTAGQYVFQADGSGGLVHQNRIQSISYQNLMSLVGIFKNNGNIFTDGTFGPSNNGLPLISLSIYIYYDNHLYIGSFDDFSVTDDGNKPYNLSYSWKFTVRYDVDTTQVLDSSVAAAGGNSLSSYGQNPAGMIPVGIANPNAGNSSPVNG